jgi:hypothetical protein
MAVPLDHAGFQNGPKVEVGLSQLYLQAAYTTFRTLRQVAVLSRQWKCRPKGWCNEPHGESKSNLNITKQLLTVNSQMVTVVTFTSLKPKYLLVSAEEQNYSSPRPWTWDSSPSNYVGVAGTLGAIVNYRAASEEGFKRCFLTCYRGTIGHGMEPLILLSPFSVVVCDKS